MDPAGDGSPATSSRKKRRIERQENHAMRGEDPWGAVTEEQLKESNMDACEKQLKARIFALEARTLELLLQAPVVDADATIEPERPPATSNTAAAEFRYGCRICFEAVETEVLIPCGHKGACKRCVETIVVQGFDSARGAPLCPICRRVLKEPFYVTPYEM
jgi:hypothetical protein